MRARFVAMRALKIVALIIASVSVVTQVSAHGSLVTPAPRNSVDRNNPRWAGGKFTPSGTLEPFGCNCTNGTQPCESAQSCFWFSNGCTIGCKECTGNGTRGFNLDTCGSGKKATITNPLHRTLNRNATANTPEDVYRFNPWRSPGNAPSFDACGMAGGTWKPAFNGAEYYTTEFARQGDLGSHVLGKWDTGVRWEVASLVEASFYIKANHGGGYQYRLCSLEEELTEECFQRMPLPFGSHEHVLRFEDHEERINATFVSEGTSPPGSTWAMNPIPMCGQETTHTKDSSGNVHTCPGGTPANWPNFPYPAPGVEHITSFVIADTLRIPESAKPGEYVLGWRWDSEQTTQVWGACSDITIVAKTEKQ